MKFFPFLPVFVCLAAGVMAQTDLGREQRQLAEMSAILEREGIARFWTRCQEEKWPVPRIPSRWHLEHITAREKRPTDAASRDFGRILADKLAAESAPFQEREAGDELVAANELMLDLAAWSASAEGYGNLFLAQRCLDLASVGLARLAANEDFPLVRLDPLAARFQQPWNDPEVRCRVLNGEAGAMLFAVAAPEEMDRTWSAGAMARRMRDNPEFRAELDANGIAVRVPPPVILDNLAFFADTDLALMQPPTLSHTWDRKRHKIFVTGLELMSTRKAFALLEFRRKVGSFPVRPTFSAAEMKDRERGQAAAARADLKVVSMEEAYSSPMAAGFAQAWKSYLASANSDLSKLPPEIYNLNALAYVTYQEVMEQRLLDRDAQLIEREKR